METPTPRSRGVRHRIAGRVIRLMGWRPEGEVPDEPRYVMIVAPHTSYWDGFIMLWFRWWYGVYLRWFVADKVMWPPLGWLLRSLGAIPIDRSRSHQRVRQMADVLRGSDEMVVGLPPEGTRKRRDHWRSGFYFIALEAEVPVCLGFIDYRRKTAGFGPLVRLSGDVKADMDVVRSFYATITPRHPDRAGPVRLRQEDDSAVDGYAAL